MQFADIDKICELILYTSLHVDMQSSIPPSHLHEHKLWQGHTLAYNQSPCPSQSESDWYSRVRATSFTLTRFRRSLPMALMTSQTSASCRNETLKRANALSP